MTHSILTNPTLSMSYVESMSDVTHQCVGFVGCPISIKSHIKNVTFQQTPHINKSFCVSMSHVTHHLPIRHVTRHRLHVSYAYVTRIIHRCAMTHSHVCNVHVHLDIGQDSWPIHICVHACAMTHSCMCAMTHSHVRTADRCVDMRVIRLIHKSNITHPRMCHAAFTRAPRRRAHGPARVPTSSAHRIRGHRSKWGGVHRGLRWNGRFWRRGVV